MSDISQRLADTLVYPLPLYRSRLYVVAVTCFVKMVRHGPRDGKVYALPAPLKLLFLLSCLNRSLMRALYPN